MTTPSDRRRYSQVHRTARLFSAWFCSNYGSDINAGAGVSYQNREGVLFAFHSAGVVLAELCSVAVQTSLQTSLTVGVHTVV